MESMSNYEQLDYWIFGLSPTGAIHKPKIQKSKSLKVQVNEKSKKNEKEKTE